MSGRPRAGELRGPTRDGATRAWPTHAAGPAEDPVRADERLRLARELYDIVAHHLSNVALRTMGQLDVSNLGWLQDVLSDVNQATSSALAELRLLAHVLEHEPGVVPASDVVSELSSRLAPTDAAERWRRRLVDRGRPATYVVPAAADVLALSVQSTIARALEVTGEAALAHAPVGARCSTKVDVGPTEVTVRSTTMLPPSRAGDGLEQELADKLRGLRERVDLSHGHVAACVHVCAGYQEWLVTLVLPLG